MAKIKYICPNTFGVCIVNAPIKFFCPVDVDGESTGTYNPILQGTTVLCSRSSSKLERSWLYLLAAQREQLHQWCWIWTGMNPSRRLALSPPFYRLPILWCDDASIGLEYWDKKWKLNTELSSKYQLTKRIVEYLNYSLQESNRSSVDTSDNDKTLDSWLTLSMCGGQLAPVASTGMSSYFSKLIPVLPPENSSL